ncbi:MAG: hypothetical protein WBC70_15645 [Candidatus Aminicenantales bacterium]
MSAEDWKDRLRMLIDSVSVLERCQRETRENFKQFCEFIAETAFESLAEEMKEHKIKAKFWTESGKSTGIRLDFPSSRVPAFHYIVSLPPNSVQMKLRLQVKGPASTDGPSQDIEKVFMESLPPDRILKVGKEDFLEDIIEHFKNYVYTALTSAK